MAKYFVFCLFKNNNLMIKMINKIEMFVELLIPDTTAITAFHTLKNMGFKQLKKLDREDYYYFAVDEDFKKFSDKMVKVDILVNANKHKYRTKLLSEKIKEKRDELHKVHVLVQDIGNNASGALSVLKHRLGFLQIKEMKKGVFWTLHLKTKDKKEAFETSKKIAESLLYNKHYQECRVL